MAAFVSGKVVKNCVWYGCHLGGYWRQILRECEIFPFYSGGLPFYGNVTPA